MIPVIQKDKIVYKHRYIEDIYFFEVNTKYISSNMLKISVIARVKLLIFSTHEMKYFCYLPKQKVNFLFIFSVKGKKLNFFHSHFSLILLGSTCLVAILLGVNKST